MKTEENNTIHTGMGWRIAATVLTFLGAVIAIILWLFFYAENFNVYQNIAIVVVILIGFVAVMGASWASWGMKQAARRNEKGGTLSCSD
jgi:hypothetical protein